MADTMPRFAEFFEALWGYEPFPWQSMLAKRVEKAGGEWPQWIDLPTASGKTACIDIAVYALAAQADCPVSKRTAPRRIWFVVDRRIVVDEAYERACRIADKLRQAKDGSLLKIVAERLRQLSGLAGNARPLATARLHGGVLKDDGWARIPSQPALITSTVDQLGSNLLFRSYAHGQKTAPIFAGLAANDSIIFLDEAHCSEPFKQTLKAIQNFRDKKWAEEPIRNPFAFVTMSATPGNQPKEKVFPRNGGEKEAALRHDLLRKRIEVSKRAELYKVGKAKNGDSLIEKAVKLVAEEKLQESKLPLKIALIVNRVATAERLARKLREEMKDRADVVLLTGRFRPYERDVLVEEWKSYLKASGAKTPDKSILFVSTQCIEVGADFSFDLMITECASLDALRQRFGRVNRLGKGNESLRSAVLICDGDLGSKASDPIYGESKKNTWKFLEKVSKKVESENGATEDDKAKKGKKKAKQKSVVDFGIRAVREFMEGKNGDLESCLAPALNAPILLPAHLDMLCQTHPVPHPVPDVDLFLHGKDRGAPEARIIWRADLSDENEESRKQWPEIIAACPPTSLETLSVPLSRLRQWLKTPKIEDDFGDVEGVRGLAPKNDKEKDKTEEEQNPHFLRWRGRRKKRKKKKGENQGTDVFNNPKEIVHGDLVVVPADYGIDGLGHTFLEESEREGVGNERLDIWESVQKAAGKAPALRLTLAIEQVKPHPQMREFLEWIKSEEPSNKEEIRERIEELKDWQPNPTEDEVALPKHVLNFLRENKIQKIERHPGDGVILLGKVASSDKEEDDLFADEDDLASASQRSVPLENHLKQVACVAETLAKHCLPKEFSPALFKTAGQWHDAGKLDERFQLYLRNGDEVAAFGEALAKSNRIPGSPQRRSEVWKSAGLPEHFRHEMLSLQLAERFAELHEEERDLILHLIASHHGCARPFAPVCEDENPPPVSGTVNGCNCNLGEKERQKFPPHRLDSGVPERFWRLTRRYGWWGLAYLESILRLADWRASRNSKKSHE